MESTEVAQGVEFGDLVTVKLLMKAVAGSHSLSFKEPLIFIKLDCGLEPKLPAKTEGGEATKLSTFTRPTGQFPEASGRAA